MPRKTAKKSKVKRDSKPKAASGFLGDAVPLESVEQLKAIAHPLRLQLLERFADQPATTKQVAEQLGYQPTRLYHHVAKLEQAGLIGLVETRQVRGTTEKYYAATATNLKVDRRAFKDRTSKVVGEIAALGVLDSLLTNVRSEITEYLAQCDEETRESAPAESLEQEILFVGSEIRADAEQLPVLRQKLVDLIDDFKSTCESADADGASTRRFRLLIGWYPRPPAGQ